MHTKLQLKAFLLHQDLIYNLYGNTLPAVISFMLPLSNYYNIGSESYFLNVPLFNYKVIFKYSYFIIPRILLCSLCHSPHYLTDSVFWRFSFISESAFFFVNHNASNYLFFIISKTKKWFDYCNLAVTLLSFLCFFFAGINIESSAETSQGTASLQAIQCTASAPTAT